MPDDDDDDDDDDSLTLLLREKEGEQARALSLALAALFLWLSLHACTHSSDTQREAHTERTQRAERERRQRGEAHSSPISLADDRPSPIDQERREEISLSFLDFATMSAPPQELPNELRVNTINKL